MVHEQMTVDYKWLNGVWTNFDAVFCLRLTNHFNNAQLCKDYAGNCSLQTNTSTRETSIHLFFENL